MVQFRSEIMCYFRPILYSLATLIFFSSMKMLSSLDLNSIKLLIFGPQERAGFAVRRGPRHQAEFRGVQPGRL